MSIQRYVIAWDIPMKQFVRLADPVGPYVLYADHEQAVAGAVAAERERLGNIYEQQSEHDWNAGYGFGQADERAACIAALEALHHDAYCVTRDENYTRPCNCLRDDAIAALRARGEQA